MKIKQVALMVGAALVTAASGSFAQQQQPLTRAEVKAELEHARSSGEYERLHSETGPGPMWWAPGDQGMGSQGAYGRSYSADSGLSREQVRSELESARASGEYERLHSETGPGPMWGAPQGDSALSGSEGAQGRSYSGSSMGGSLTREQVRSELESAKASGEYEQLHSETAPGPMGTVRRAR